MKLAEKFTFNCKAADGVEEGILYTASRRGEDEYRIDWTDSCSGMPTHTVETEAGIRRSIINGTYRVQEILIHNVTAAATARDGNPPPAEYVSGGRYLLQKFTFRVAGRATTYTANLNNGTYEVTYDSLLPGSKPVFTVDAAKELIDSAVWVDVQKVKAEEPKTDEVIRIRHKATSEREYDLIRQADGQYRFSDMDHAGWSAEEGQKFFDNGTWIRVELSIDGNLLVSGSIAEDTINIKDYFADLPVEAEDLDLLPDYGVTLDDLRRFAAETGFVVEVDADFYAVYRPAQVPTKFLAVDDAELAAVMLAVRTLNNAVDKG